MKLGAPIAVVLLLTASSQAMGAEEIRRPKIYKPAPGACYAQLQPTWPKPPYVSGEDQPVCRAVLRNLNKFCDRPPQYDHRLLHSSITDLRAPQWRSLVASANFYLVREAFTATATTSESKNAYWTRHESRLRMLAEEGALRLKTADIDIDSDSRIESVYVLEGSYPRTAVAGSNSPIFFVAERGQRIQVKDSIALGAAALGDLWSFDGGWYSIGFDFYKRRPSIRVSKIVRYDATRIDAITDCAIQRTNTLYIQGEHAHF